MKLTLYVISFILLQTSVFAQQFTASSSHSQVPVGARFKITYTLDGDASNFSPPALQDFNVLMGPSTSRSVQIVNGQMSSKNSFSYVISPRKAGTFTIPPASVVSNGKRLQSNSLTIKVTNSGQPQAQSSQQGGNEISKHLFLKAASSKRKVYLGEQLTVAYKLYNRVRFIDSGIEKMPSLNGFWSQDVKTPFDHVNWKNEYVNGMNFEVAELKKTVLFPQRTGKLQIDPLEMSFEVQQMSRNFFDNFFGRAKTTKVKVKSPTVNIEVLPLPEKGKPSSFGGAVGKFTMKTSVDKTSVPANEAITLKVEVKGTGNLKLLDAPPIEFPADFEVYDPKVNDDIAVLESGVKGKREFEYLIIPRHAGQFEIPAIEFSYFDPSAKRYQSVTSEPINVNVSKGTGDQSSITSSGYRKEDVKLLGDDIRHIHEDKYSTVEEGNSFFGSAGFWTLFLLPVLVFIAAFVLRKRIEEQRNDIVGKKKKKAEKVAGKYLKAAKQKLTENDTQGFYEQIDKAIAIFLSDKMTLPVSSLSRENIVNELKIRNISNDIIDNYTSIVDECQMARFSGAAAETKGEMMNRASDLITILNKSIG